MSTLKDIFAFTQEFAPADLCEEWDNCGILVGSGDTIIKKALLCLDISKNVINEAKRLDCDLIISHHPVIFRPLSSVDKDDVVYHLIHNDISALCLHTNLDRAEGGVNTALSDALKLKNTQFFPDDFIITGDTDRPFTPDELAVYIKEKLGAGMVRYTKNSDVSRIALSSGGGGEGIFLSEKYGFDTFISGEIKHHEFIFANDNGINAFEAGHFATEIVVLQPLKSRLSKRFNDIMFHISGDEKDPCLYV